MEVHRGGTVVASLIFNLFRRRTQVVRITPQSLYSRWKNRNFPESR